MVFFAKTRKNKEMAVDWIQNCAYPQKKTVLKSDVFLPLLVEESMLRSSKLAYLIRFSLSNKNTAVATAPFVFFQVHTVSCDEVAG